MVKDHSDSEIGNPLPPHRLLFSSSSKGSFICIIPQTGYHRPRPLLHQSWSTGWNEKYYQKDDIFQYFVQYFIFLFHFLNEGEIILILGFSFIMGLGVGVGEGEGENICLYKPVE